MSAFLYPLTVYYGTTGTERLVPTVNALPIGTQPLQDLLILDQVQGLQPPGLYMHQGRRWRYVLSSVELGVAAVEKNPLVVYSQLVASTAVPAGSQCFINGIPMPGLVLAPGSATYAVKLPATAPGPGPTDDPDVKTWIAGPDVSGHCVAMLVDGGQVSVLKSTDVANSNAALGITEGAASAGTAIKVRVRGLMVEPSWNFVVGRPVFCAANGTVSQAVVDEGFSLVVGVATGINSMYVDIKQPYVLTTD